MKKFQSNSILKFLKQLKNHPFVVKNQPDQNEFAQWVKKVNEMKISDEKR